MRMQCSRQPQPVIVIRQNDRIERNLTVMNCIAFLLSLGDIDWYLNSNMLLNKQFPFIFKAVKGSCQHAIGHNWSNESEVNEAVSFVTRLLPPKSKAEGLKKIPPWKIGVITPYHMQNYKIVQALKALKMGKVDVGTAESFRGKQKSVVIISTVRSEGEHSNADASDSEILDFTTPFAKSEVSFMHRVKFCDGRVESTFFFFVFSTFQWLNTVINRARCLVIVLGDPDMLKQNSKWLCVIERCVQHGSYIGD